MNNLWIPDGMKDSPANVNRFGFCENLIESLDRIFAEFLPINIIKNIHAMFSKANSKEVMMISGKAAVA